MVIFLSLQNLKDPEESLPESWVVLRPCPWGRAAAHLWGPQRSSMSCTASTLGLCCAVVQPLPTHVQTIFLSPLRSWTPGLVAEETPSSQQPEEDS